MSDSDRLIAYAETRGYELDPSTGRYMYGEKTMLERERELADRGLRDKTKLKGLEGVFGTLRDPSRIDAIGKAKDAWDDLIAHDARTKEGLKSLKDVEKFDTGSYRKIADKATLRVDGRDFNLLGKNVDKLIEDRTSEIRRLQAEKSRLTATTGQEEFERVAQQIAKDNPFAATILGIDRSGPSFFKQEKAKKSKIPTAVEKFQKLTQDDILGGRTKTLKGLAKNLGISQEQTTDLLKGKGITIGKTGRLTTPEKEIDALSERIARLGREAEDLSTSARRLRRR